MTEMQASYRVRRYRLYLWRARLWRVVRIVTQVLWDCFLLCLFAAAAVALVGYARALYVALWGAF